MSVRQQRLNLLKQKIKNTSTHNSIQPPIVEPIQSIQPIESKKHELKQNNSNLEEIILTQNLIQNPSQNITQP